MKSTKLILASASPRRRELFSLLGRPFKTEAAKVNENVPLGISAAESAQYLSCLKARAVYSAHTQAGESNVTVIGSDTIVILDDVIYGKPVDKQDAFRMLRSLSGRTHEVRTGVTVISDGAPVCTPFELSFTSSALVTFYELSDEEILDYISTGEPMDKAGAYGVQGRGALLVERIEGDFYTVMGLPIAALSRALIHNGIFPKEEKAHEKV